MDLLGLEYFTRVAARKSITKVSKEYHVVPSTISNQIKCMEEELETSLFYRGPNTMILTESGELVYRYACRVLSLVNSAVNELKDQNNALETINLYVETCPLTFPKIIKGFKELYPHVSWNLIQNLKQFNGKDSSCNLLLYASDEKLDLPNNITLFEEECLIGVSAKNPLASQKEVRLADLAQVPFIQRSSLSVDFNAFLNRKLEKAHFHPVSYDCCDHSITLNEMIAQDMGIAFLPWLTWFHYNDPQIALIRVPELNIVRYINISWEPDQYLSKNARAFIAYTQEFFARLTEAR
jgi:DNA-binding transcriptional LysR family regulator